VSFLGLLLVGLLIGAVSLGVMVRYSTDGRLRPASVPMRVRLPVLAINVLLFIWAASRWASEGWAGTAGYLLGIAIALAGGLIVLRRRRDEHAR
jgi:hypothetical protein